MNEQQELYGVRVGSTYFVGIGKAGFRLENEDLEALTLQNTRVRTLKDPYVGMTEQSVYVWNEEYLKGLFNYVPNNDAIPAITFQKKGIDRLIAFLLRSEPAS